MKGGWLPIDTYSGAAEGGPFPLSAHDLEAALKCLEADGLVASIYERLDGLLYALSQKGRLRMEGEGFRFSDDELNRTRRLFASWLCKVPI